MENRDLEQIAALVFQLTTIEQVKLIERMAAHLAQTIDSPDAPNVREVIADRTYEVWSPQDEGGTVTALNQALRQS